MIQRTVADYLVNRLHQAGITGVFGVPGDFNFNILTAIEANENVRWIGCCNELNAGYAADGYARIKGLGALVTTFGVGELSAVNAVAGCFSEHVPLIMISGTPNRPTQERHALVHHTLGNGDFDVYHKMFTHITAAQAILTPENAVSEIERVLGVALHTKKPVYIALAADVARLPILGNASPIAQSSDPNALAEATDAILSWLERAKKPVIIAEMGVIRRRLQKQVATLVERSGFPVTTMFMGKGAVDETMPQYIGLYYGHLVDKEVGEVVEAADCILALGVLLTDFNTGAFTAQLDPMRMIDVRGSHVVVKKARYDNVLMEDLLVKLTEKLTPRSGIVPILKPPFGLPSGDPDAPLAAGYLYPRLQRFLRPGDIVVSESGTIGMGFAQVRMPSGVDSVTQALWGAIGWATPAAFGVGLAAKDRRVILLTGDGSLQQTVQEVSSMLRFGLKPIIVLLNNGGYTIERLLHTDPMDPFNDIACWNFTDIPSVFGGKAFAAQARTNGEFDIALKQAAEKQEDRLCLIEAITDKMDAPPIAAALNRLIMAIYGRK